MESRNILFLDSLVLFFFLVLRVQVRVEPREVVQVVLFPLTEGPLDLRVPKEGFEGEGRREADGLHRRVVGRWTVRLWAVCERFVSGL